MFEWWEKLSGYLVFDILGLIPKTQLGEAFHFFVYDTIKIFILLVVIVYAVTFFRSFLPIEKARDYISGKHRIVGHVLAAFFGMLTPFCSCSAIPLFIGFLQARIPLGVTFSYLISAPLSDAVFLALMFSLFGFKITLLYIAFALTLAIVAGMIIGSMNLDKEVLIEIKPINAPGCACNERETVLGHRIRESWEYTMDIFKKVAPYVVIGIAIGAFIHGYIPADFITRYAGGDAWYAPIVGVLMGIPMYSNAAGVLPLVEVLTQKGMLLGTALSFMMAVVALSLPEAMILKRVLSLKLIGIFFGIVGSGILLIGYVLNAIL